MFHRLFRRSKKRPFSLSRIQQPLKGAPRRPRLMLERLEDRTLLSCFGTLASDLAGQLAAIEKVVPPYGANKLIQDLEQVPFIGNNKSVLDAAKFFQTFDSKLTGALSPLQDSLLTDAQAKTTIQQAIFKALPAGLVAKTDHSNPNSPPVDSTQIQVTLSGSGPSDCTISIEMHLHQNLLSVNQSLQFGLGLPVLPISLQAGGTIDLKVGYDLELGFTYKGATNSFTIDTNKKLNIPQAQDPFHVSGHEFVLEAQASLSNNANIQIHVGFFGGLASDAGTLQNPTVLTAGFAIDDLQNLGSAEVFGQADAYLMLDLFIADSKNNAIKDFPSLGTTFELHWSIDSKQQNDPSHMPSVKFDSLTISAGDLLNGVIGKIIQYDQIWTKPLQPLIDVLKAKLPVLSDLAGQPVTLEKIARLLANNVLPPDIGTIVVLVDDVLNLANDINQINVLPSGAMQVNFGDFHLGGQDDNLLDSSITTHDLEDYAKGLITPDTPLTTFQLSGNDFQSLQTIVQNIKKQLDNYGPVGKAAEDFLPTNHANVDLSFPFFDDPANGIFKLLLGQDVSLVKFTASAYASFSAIPPPFNLLATGIPGIGAGFKAQLPLDAYFEADYDTYGIREFLQNLYNQPSAKQIAEYISDGFTMPTWDQVSQSHGNHLSLSGNITAFASVGIPVFQVVLQGGVNANLSFSLQDPNHPNAISTFRLFRDLQKLPDIFHFSGDVDGFLQVLVKIGVDVPWVGFVGYEKDFNIADGKIIDFGSGQTSNPFIPPPNVHLAQGQPVPNMQDEFNVPGGVLVLNVGLNAPLRNYQSNVVDEVYTISHDTSVLSTDPLTGEALLVSFGGITQRYAGVTSIQANGGDGNDVLTIESMVQADAFITEGNGNDQVTYLGNGNAHIVAGDGNDILTGGHGYNYFRSGSGNTTLIGGDGKTASGAPPWIGQAQDVNGTYYINDFQTSGAGNNVLQGGGPARNYLVAVGPGRNQLVAGDQDDYLEGDGGINTFIAGKGHDSVYINGGGMPPPGGIPNVVHWQDGDGNLDVRTADTLSYNALEVVGNDQPDHFTLNPYHGVFPGVRVLANAKQITWDGFIDKVSMDGGKGADTITVNDLETAPVLNVGVNDGEASEPDGSADVVNVEGSPNAHTILVKTESAFLKAAGAFPGPMGGIMLVQTHPHYQVHVAVTNHEDTLNVFAKGSNNTINVQSNTGHTVIYGDAGNDVFNVSSDAPANTGVLLEPPPQQQPPRPPFGLFGMLDLHAGPGKNALTVSESGSNQPDHVTLTNGHISGGPLHSFNPVTNQPVTMTYQINYDTSANGSFAGGIFVKTGSGADMVMVQSTPAGVPVTIRSGGGGDHVIIGDPGHTLDGIGGVVFVDGGDGTAVLTFDDKNAGAPEKYLISFSQIVGNFLRRGTKGFVFRNVGTMILDAGGHGNHINVNAVGDAATEINAGAGDDIIRVGDVANILALDRPLTVNGQGGKDQLILHDEGRPTSVNYDISENSVQGSNFQPISYSSIADLTLHTATPLNGSNHVTVLGTNQGTVTTLDLSPTNHVVNVGDAINTLDHLRGLLTIHGQQGAQDSLNVFDLGAPSAHTYVLDNGSISRSGAAQITFDHITTVMLWAGKQNSNTIHVRGTGTGLQLTTVNAGNAGDLIRVGDVNDTLNSIHSPVSVQGGTGLDTLQILDEGFGGPRKYSLSATAVTAGGAVHVGYGAIETLDVRGAAGKNTFQVTGFAAGTQVILNGGGAGDNVLVGPNQSNVWKVTTTNAGTLDTAASFNRVQSLTGGSLTDVFQIQTGGQVTGTIAGGGGTNTLDFGAYSKSVVVNLQTGFATSVTGGVSSIQNVIGGNGGPTGTYNLLIGAGGGTLTGGTGRRNILVAGSSAATLEGGNEDDLLIAGTTNYDTEAGLGSWLKIAAHWAGASSYATRVSNLMAGNGVPKLDASTVHGNGGGNTLIGQGELALIYSDALDFIFGFDPNSKKVKITP